MNADLKLLAIMLEEWPNRPYASLQNGQVWTHDKPLNSGDSYSQNQWLQARRELGLDQPEVTEEEERMWAELDKKKASKYHKKVKGVQIDVYDVLKAFNVTNPADAHAIKKMLCPGQRGVKDAIQDRREAIQSLERAIELESE